MNSRERVLNILNRKTVDRLPVDLWYTPEISQILRSHFNVADDEDFYKIMDLDKIVWVNAEYPVEANRTIFGSRLKSMDAGDANYMEIQEPGLKGCETLQHLSRYSYWPDAEKFDYDVMVHRAQKASENYVTLGPWVSFYEIYCQLRGLEQAMMDLVMVPDYVHAVLDKIESCQTSMLARFFDRAADFVDMVFISDDMGSQNNLMMSLDMWDDFFKERMKRWCDMIHSYGIKVFFHSDGAMEALIPRLAEVGVDVLNPIQHVCPGMEMTELKKKYGEKLIFHGGIENQSILPFGTTEQVREGTLQCLQQLGKGMEGYICCSCHNIQPGTPVENILELVKTVIEYREG
jgi:uroporphyrinogen decarboxylase